jgi:hypothetical protein
MEKRRRFSTRLVKRDVLCVVAHGASRAEMTGVHRIPGVTPKRQTHWRTSVLIVLRISAAVQFSHARGQDVKGLSER